MINGDQYTKTDPFSMNFHNGETQCIIDQHVAHIQAIRDGPQINKRSFFKVDNRPVEEGRIEDQQSIKATQKKMSNGLPHVQISQVSYQVIISYYYKYDPLQRLLCKQRLPVLFRV